MNTFLKKIRRAVKQELARHDWASARTPSGKNLRRTFAKEVLNRLNSYDDSQIHSACQSWIYVKMHVWKEHIDWWPVYNFIIEPIPTEYSELAECDIVSAMSEHIAADIDAEVLQEI